MTGTSSNLTRRKFMLVSSAAIASPQLLNVAGTMAAGKTAETRTTEAGIATKEPRFTALAMGVQAARRS
jgi:hypothetical protein